MIAVFLPRFYKFIFLFKPILFFFRMMSKLFFSAAYQIAATGADNQFKTAMEADTKKHGRSSVSQKNRGNIFMMALFVVLCNYGTSFANETVSLPPHPHSVFHNSTNPTFHLVQQPNPSYVRKSPVLAWGLSFIYPGIGQIYNGEIVLGAVHAGFATTGWILTFVGDDLRTVVTGMVFVVSTWIYSQIDAPIGVIKKNNANRYALWNLGNGDAFLALEPDFRLEPILNKGLTLTPTYGIGLKLKF